jgi:IS30 family transposase
MSTHKSFTTATERPVNLEQVAQELSGRPRKTLGWDNPAERFRDLLVSIQLARWRNV